MSVAEECGVFMHHATLNKNCDLTGIKSLQLSLLQYLGPEKEAGQ